MAFPTLTFSYVLLPVYAAGSLLLRGKKGERWLLGCSLFFLLFFNIWILFSCVIMSGAAYLMNNKSRAYIGTIVVQFVIFAVCRAAVVFQYRTALSPEMGILVTTVATIPLAVCAMNNVGYLLDVKNNRCERAKRFADYLGFTLFLPALFTGPYYGYAEYRFSMGCRTADKAIFLKGLRSYIIGLGKAVLLGAGMVSMWSEINVIDKSLISPAAALLGLLAAAFAVYYILTGYNDMSVGLGGMFGFEMTKGYDAPIFAKGFIDFLKRFQVYMWNWTQRYVIAEAQMNSHIIYFVLWIVLMLLYGMEANLLIWGVLFGVFASAEYYLLDLRKMHKRDFVNALYSAPCILFGFIFFCFFDLGGVASYIGNFSNLNVGVASTQLAYLLTRYLYPLLACLLFSLDIPWHLCFRHKNKIAKAAAGTVGVLFLILLLFATTAYLIDTRTNPFLLLEVRVL